MRSTTSTARALAALTLVAATATSASAAAADSDLVTRCSGTAGAVTVPGDLVVPTGASCVLDGTTVGGDVRIAAGASLITTGATFDGEVRLAEDAYLDAVDTSIAGRVVNRDGYGVYLEGGSAGSYVAPTGSADTFLTAFETDIGTVRAETGVLLLESASVTGNVTATGLDYADLIDTWVTGSVSVSDAVGGSVVCGSEIDKNATFTGNAGVQLGVGNLLVTCEDSVYIGRNATITATSAGTALGDVVIRGDLTGEGNDPAPVVSGLRVRGTIGGQFSESSAQALDALQLQAAAPDRPNLDAAIETRREAAQSSAEYAGPANL